MKYRQKKILSIKKQLSEIRNIDKFFLFTCIYRRIDIECFSITICYKLLSCFLCWHAVMTSKKFSEKLTFSADTARIISRCFPQPKAMPLSIIKDSPLECNAFPQKGLSYEKSGKTTFLQTLFSAADKSCGTSGSAVHTMQPAFHPVLPYRPLSQ